MGKKKNRASKAGMGPGSLVYIGSESETPINIRFMNFNLEKFEEGKLNSIAECARFKNTDTITWIDIDGIHDPKLIESVGAFFDVHVLVQEDILNSTSRPKVEVFEDYTFVTLRMLDVKTGDEINDEQFSLIIGNGFLVTFQERPGDDFDGIRDRIRTAKGRVRSRDAEYLAYLLLDVVVDNYITVSQQFFEKIESLESLVINKSSEAVLYSILGLRKELIHFKRSVDPLKEAINTLHNETENDNVKFYRDLYDHIIYESENLSMYREMIANLLDLHHSRVNIKTNDVMRVLTIITTIFVPLTFIVGVYGMNFHNMPEYDWKYGYSYVWTLMVLILIGMIYFFKRRKWL